jgi:hypothetical protein
MLKNDDEQWLRTAYPGLVRDPKGVAGNLEFKATYDPKSNRFLILAEGVADPASGVALSGQFKIRIEERNEKTFSSLPALFVEDVEASDKRHFSQKDKSGCLCSPFVEDEFLEPEFQFRAFLEQLVIPFLYAQVFCSLKEHWPWSEYAHGATGLLEAYSQMAGQAKSEHCLRLLRQDRAWERIKSTLQQRPYIKGHTPCFCPKMDHIRRCHPTALRGAQRLQEDIKALAIPTQLTDGGIS